MDSSSFRTIFVAAVVFLMLYRKFIFEQENNSSSSSLCLASPSRSPSLSHNWTNDVFPSFHEGDVRKGILSHVQKAFERMGIDQYKDNEMERGESISYELVSAIRGSKIAVVFLSRNYASSKWCLDELVEIMKCRRDFGQIVLPIFYQVDPSDVRKQTRGFGKVFRKTCAGKTNEEIGRWREALAVAASIAGYHSTNWDNEAAMVENIAIVVSKKLTLPGVGKRTIDFNDFVGMGARMEKMRQLLCLDLDEVRMIGIWGLPGVGKSTIARLLFNQLTQRFDVSLYINDMKALYKRPSCSDVDFMSLLSDQNDNEVFNLEVERERLKRKKVLLIIDNVERSEQLVPMMKEISWFGPGSRIIIVAEDRNVLDAHRISYIYRVALPSDYEALQIFCMAAFGQRFPKDGFEDLAEKVCNTAGRLPLRLKIMGSYFRGMSKQEWIDNIGPF